MLKTTFQGSQTFLHTIRTFPELIQTLIQIHLTLSQPAHKPNTHVSREPALIYFFSSCYFPICLVSNKFGETKAKGFYAQLNEKAERTVLHSPFSKLYLNQWKFYWIREQIESFCTQPYINTDSWPCNFTHPDILLGDGISSRLLEQTFPPSEATLCEKKLCTSQGCLPIFVENLEFESFFFFFFFGRIIIYNTIEKLVLRYISMRDFASMVTYTGKLIIIAMF